MVFALVLILLAVGSVLFHLLSPWRETPLASNWGMIDDTVAMTLVITGTFFVVIVCFLGYCIIRYQHKEGHTAAFEPENKKLEWWLIAFTTVAICALLAPGLFVYNKFVHVPADATRFEAVGQQWMWTFRLPGADGIMGTSDISHMGIDNPLGLNPDDPNGQDDLLVFENHIHLEVDQPVEALLRSKDVLHNFYVPQFRVKMDLVPGLVSYIWFTPTVVGSYEIICSEYCGVGHYNMRGRVTVDSTKDYQQWLATLPTFAETLNKSTVTGLAEQGKNLAQSQGCLACHSVDGGKSLGPGWKGLYGKTENLVGGGSIVADEDYLKKSITDPAADLVDGFPNVMVPYNLSEEQLDAFVAYIRTLSDQAATDSDNQTATDSPPPEPASEFSGLAEEGHKLQQAHGCYACHSLDGSPSVGPSWKGLYGKTEILNDGSTVTVDEDYLRESILDPGAKIVKGYPPVMQAYTFTDAELDALIAFTKALSGDSEEE